MVRKELNGVTDAFGVCFGDEDSVAAIMLKGWVNVPAGSAMGGPRVAFVSGFVSDDFGSRWGERGSVEIEISKKLGVGRELGIDLGRA